MHYASSTLLHSAVKKVNLKKQEVAVLRQTALLQFSNRKDTSIQNFYFAHESPKQGNLRPEITHF